jgi:hypothetical protein
MSRSRWSLPQRQRAAQQHLHLAFCSKLDDLFLTQVLALAELVNLSIHREGLLV